MNKRQDYFEKYNMEYINALISEEYGLVHFDFSDGNNHIDMGNGNITVFDFDNCMYCWYIFDLANLWTHGEGGATLRIPTNGRKEWKLVKDCVNSREPSAQVCF